MAKFADVSDPPDFNGDWRTCGCGGKTPLERIVFPALDEARSELDDGTKIQKSLDCGLIPLSSDIDSTVITLTEDENILQHGHVELLSESDYWSVGATFVDPSTARSPESLSEFIKSSYSLSDIGVRNNVVKGHTVQLPKSSAPIQFFDLHSPNGRGLSGYWAVNVDAIHAFPDLGPAVQSRIATVNALNDCYAVGANKCRQIRPLVLAPKAMTPPISNVYKWFKIEAPKNLEMKKPTVIGHSGDSWVFGASVIAKCRTTPPTNISAVESGDQVLLHRPLGSLSLIAAKIEDNKKLHAEMPSVNTMMEDNFSISKAILNFLPDANETLIPKKHLKLATDVSGPGIKEINRIVSKANKHLHVNSLPLIDEQEIFSMQQKWSVPDVTSETNGPIAFIGRPCVIDKVESELKSVGPADPVRLGEIENGGGDMTSDAPIQPYIETFTN